MLMHRVVTLALLSLAVTACDEGIRGTDTPTLKVSPKSFAFPKVALNSSVDKEVTLTNEGTGDLLIGKIHFDIGNSTEYQLFYRDFY